MVLGEQGKWLGVWGPERIVEMACESGGRRWRVFETREGER